MVESLRRRADRFGLDIILINEWEGTVAAAEAARYCELWGIEGTVLLDEHADLARAIGIRGVPTNVFVDEHGVVQAVGATQSEELLRGAIRLVPALGSERDLILAANRTREHFAVEADGR